MNQYCKYNINMSPASKVDIDIILEETWQKVYVTCSLLLLYIETKYTVVENS